MSLAILANLTLMNTAIIVVALLFSNILLNYRHYNPIQSVKAVGIVIVTGVIPIGFLVWLLLEFKKRGSLYYGTLDGFWELTLSSLVKLLTGSESILPSFLVLFYFLLTVIIFSYLLIKSKTIKSLWRDYNLFFILLVGNLMAIFIMGNFLKINYPEDRTGLYLFPFAIGAFIFLLDQVNQKINKKLLIVIVLPFLFFPVHFLFSLNFTHSKLWKDERIPNTFYQKVLDDSALGNKPNTIGGYLMRTLCWSYTNFRNDGQLNQVQNTHYPEYISDYQIVETKPEERFNEFYHEIGYDPVSKLSLLKRNETIKVKKLDSISIKTTGEINKLYYNIYIGKIDSLVGKTLLIDLNLKLSTEETPFIAWIVAQVKDKNSKGVAYEFIALNWKRKTWNNQNKELKGNMFIYDIPAGSKEIYFYIWNINKSVFMADEIKCTINQVLFE
jgi:hypothetical protein